MEFLTTSDFIEMNNIELEKIQSRSIKNRIKNDCNTLYKDFYNVLIEGAPNNTSIKVVEILSAKKRTYKFVITPNYPFYPPKIYINDRPYMDMLQMRGNYERDMVKKLRGKECLCCYSLNCSTNWSPAVRLYHIINEIKSILKFKKDIINLLLADKIKIKYNIPYAYFEAYLV
jgi:ubiquitin-protein ligase